jgi:hypothetical protein
MTRTPRLGLVNLRQLQDLTLELEHGYNVIRVAAELVESFEALRTRCEAELHCLQGQVQRAENLCGILVGELEKRRAAASRPKKTTDTPAAAEREEPQ